MLNIYIYLTPFVAILLILINYLLSSSNSYIEKDGPFECGFTSYQQSRSAFSVSFILVAILFLPFDLEISSLLPYVVNSYNNDLYGLTILTIFLIVLVIAFVYEINLNALKMSRRYEKLINPLIMELYIQASSTTLRVGDEGVRCRYKYYIL